MRYQAYGQTWWSRAWIDALVEPIKADTDRLTLGRAHARGNRVCDLNIDPGAIDALVKGDRPRQYAVTISVPILSEATWDQLLEAIACQAGHIAALIEGELPPGLGVTRDLVPSADEMRINCSCADPTSLCEHAAAVCYLTAEMFDADVGALLLLRGRSKADVLSALRDRRQSGRSGPPGMLARDAYRREIAPLPLPALPPQQPGSPARLAVDPPAACGVSAEELAELAAKAAQRAWDLLTECPIDIR